MCIYPLECFDDPQAAASQPPHLPAIIHLPAAVAEAALLGPRELWTCAACSFGNDPDQGRCEVCQNAPAAAKDATTGGLAGKGKAAEAAITPLLEQVMKSAWCSRRWFTFLLALERK